MEGIQRHERVDVADVLRGFAVMAIILLHAIEHFNFYNFPDPESREVWLRFADKAVWDGLFFMFGGKAYAIFALLFGFSFFIQHDNQRMRGVDFRARFCWRLLLLFLIGQVNAAFFTGEILVLYALVGFVLVATCRFSNKTILILSAICLLQPVCLWQIIRSVLDPAYEISAIDAGPYWAATYAVQDGGSFWETVKVNLWEGQLASLAWAWNNGRIFQTAALFMTGMLIGRQGWFKREHLRLWGVVLAASLAVFFPLHGLTQMLSDYIVNPNTLTPLKLLVSSLAKVSFMGVLTSAIIFGYYRTHRISKWLSLLIPYGRMSMTCYVTQGIIGAAIFYHWGLHLHAGILESELIGIGIFLMQYAACRWWMNHHSHGPLERMWKAATFIDNPFSKTK